MSRVQFSLKELAVVVGAVALSIGICSAGESAKGEKALGFLVWYGGLLTTVGAVALLRAIISPSQLYGKTTALVWAFVAAYWLGLFFAERSEGFIRQVSIAPLLVGLVGGSLLTPIAVLVAVFPGDAITRRSADSTDRD
ncbi:MAG: hypothetical protein AAGB00_12635 [Planctomycetota bacterium]